MTAGFQSQLHLGKATSSLELDKGGKNSPGKKDADPTVLTRVPVAVYE